MLYYAYMLLSFPFLVIMKDFCLTLFSIFQNFLCYFCVIFVQDVFNVLLYLPTFKHVFILFLISISFPFLFFSIFRIRYWWWSATSVSSISRSWLLSASTYASQEKRYVSSYIVIWYNFISLDFIWFNLIWLGLIKSNLIRFDLNLNLFAVIL